MAEPAFPLLALYAAHVPGIDTFWSTLFTQLAHKISPPGLNISGQTLFSMKASVLSATPGGAAGSNSTEMHVGSASIVNANITQQKMSVQRGHAKLSVLLMTNRSQLTLNKPRKGRLVSGSVAIQERGPSSGGSGPGVNGPSPLRDLFPLKFSVAAQQFSVSLPTAVITNADLIADPILLGLVVDSFMLLKRMVVVHTFLSSDLDVANQSTQLVERTALMRTKLTGVMRLCDLKSKMIREELLGDFCVRMKEQHGLTWEATASLKTMIDLALASRDHKSGDVNVDSGVVTSINDIEYDETVKGFVNRRWTGKAKREDKDSESEESQSDTESETDSSSVDNESDTESQADPEETGAKPAVSNTAIKLMAQLEPSPLILPYRTIPLQRDVEQKWVAWSREDRGRLYVHHGVGRSAVHDAIDLVHSFEKLVIASNR